MGFFDFFRPTWKHSDPEIRLEAVRALTDAETLKQVARTDDDVRIRRAALKKIDDVAFLQDLAHTSPDASVRELAHERAHTLLRTQVLQAPSVTAALHMVPTLPPALLLDLVLQAPQEELQRAALERITDAAVLAEVVKKSTVLDLRKQALGRIQDQRVLQDMGLWLQHKELAPHLVTQVTDPLVLEGWLQRGTKPVRQAVLSKREPLAGGATVRPTWSAEKAQEKRQKLSRLAENISLSSEWDQATDQLDALQEEWRALGDVPPEDQAVHARFVQALEHFRVRKQAALERFRKDAAREEARRRAAQQRHAKRQPQAGTEPPLPAAPSPTDPAAPAPSEPSEKPDLRDVYKEHQARLEQVAQELSEELDSLTRKQIDERLQRWQEAMQNVDALPAAWQRQVRARLHHVREQLNKRLGEVRAAQEWKAWGTLSSLEQLCSRAEALAQEPDLQRVRADFPAVSSQWRALRYVRMDKAVALKERAQAAMHTLQQRVDEHRNQERQKQQEVLPQKEALCQQAEALAQSTEWATTDATLRALQVQWKTLGPVPREQAQALQQRFRAACDQFYKRRNAYLATQKTLHQQRIQQMEALCVKAEALAQSDDWKKTADALRTLMNDWKAIGPVPRKLNQPLWERFRTAVDGFYARREGYFEQQKGEAEQNQRQKEAICNQLAQLLDTTPMIANAAYDKLQQWRNEWRDIGPVPKQQAQALDQKFLQLCERFLQRFQPQLGDIQRQELKKALSRFENRIVLPASLQASASNK